MPLRDDTPETTPDTPVEPAPPSEAPLSRVNTSPGAIQAWLIDRIATLVQRSPHDIDIHAPFSKYGMDSVENVTISGELEDLLGRRLESTLVWDYPTIALLTEYLSGTTPALQRDSPHSVRIVSTSAMGKHGFEHFDDVKNQERKLQLLAVPSVGNPYFRVSEGVNGDRTVIEGHEYINFCSYNYVGLSGHPEVSQASKDAIDRYGTSVSASRVISGERPVHRELEAALARFLGVEDTVVYVGGHGTNVSTIGHLFEPEDMILYDHLIHDSVQHGAELSGATRLPFRHQDLDDLESILASRRKDRRHVLIVVEGVYSADGDICDLPRLIEIKKRYNAFLMVDEAHSLGVLGRHGRGVGEHFGVDMADVDIWMGTLSKSLASCGGYIGGSRRLINYLRYTSPGFVFSVGIPPSNAAASLSALRVLEREPERVATLHERVELFMELTRKHGLNTGTASGSGVVPVIIHDTLQTVRMADILKYRGINVAPMIYPAVSNDGARLRFFVSSMHTEEQIRYTVDTVARELSRLKEIFSGAFEILEAEAPPGETNNQALARDGFNGFVKLDVKALSRQLDEDVVYYFPGNSPLAGVYRGKDTVLDFFIKIFRCAFGTLNVRLDRILADEGHSVLIWHNVARLPGSDVQLDTDICEVLTIRNSKVVEAHWYIEDQKNFDDFMTAGAKLMEQYEQQASGAPIRNPYA